MSKDINSSNILANFNRIQIERCERCDLHKWCTFHNEKQQIAHFELIRHALRTLYPEIKVLENSLPQGTQMSKDGTIRDSKTNVAVKFPRNGAFEVVYNNNIMFSKLKTKKWPTIEQIIESIEKEKQRVDGNMDILTQAKDLLVPRGNNNRESGNIGNSKKLDSKSSSSQLNPKYGNNNQNSLKNKSEVNIVKDVQTRKQKPQTNDKIISYKRKAKNQNNNSTSKPTKMNLEGDSPVIFSTNKANKVYKKERVVPEEHFLQDNDHLSKQVKVNESQEQDDYTQKEEQEDEKFEIDEEIDDNMIQTQYNDIYSTTRDNFNSNIKTEVDNSEINKNHQNESSIKHNNQTDDKNLDKHKFKADYSDQTEPKKNSTELKYQTEFKKSVSQSSPNKLKFDYSKSSKKKVNNKFVDAVNENSSIKIQATPSEEFEAQDSFQMQENQQEDETNNYHVDPMLAQEEEENKQFQAGEYNIIASKDNIVNKKIKQQNMNDVDVTYQLQSSNEELMSIKNEDVLIFANDQGYFKISFLPNDYSDQAVLQLLIHDSLMNKMCIILNVDFK